MGQHTVGLEQSNGATEENIPKLLKFTQIIIFKVFLAQLWGFGDQLIAFFHFFSFTFLGSFQKDEVQRQKSCLVRARDRLWTVDSFWFYRNWAMTSQAGLETPVWLKILGETVEQSP